MNTLKTLAAAVVLLGAGTSVQAGVQFKLSNETGTSVTEFQISAAGAEEWGENLMEGYELPADGEVSVTIDNQGVCEADILVTFEDGSTSDEREVDICDLETYSIHE